MPGAGITNTSRFIERALSTIRDLLESNGQPLLYPKLKASSAETVSYAKALDRSVTGSMNELIIHATDLLAESNLSPSEVGPQLNDVLISSLARTKSDRYGKPSEAFKQLTDQLD